MAKYTQEDWDALKAILGEDNANSLRDDMSSLEDVIMKESKEIEEQTNEDERAERDAGNVQTTDVTPKIKRHRRTKAEILAAREKEKDKNNKANPIEPKVETIVVEPTKKVEEIVPDEVTAFNADTFRQYIRATIANRSETTQDFVEKASYDFAIYVFGNLVKAFEDVLKGAKIAESEKGDPF